MNIIEISNNFPTETEVTNYFEYVRWGKKVNCCHCGSAKISRRYEDFRYNCYDCTRKFSVTTNTQLHSTNLSLRTWLVSFALITDAKKGISALQLQRNIGVSYVTAWRMYHRIREIMSDGNHKLNGIVEMDETYIGGKPRKYQYAKFGQPKPIPELDKKLESLNGKYVFDNDAYKKNALSENAKRGRGTLKTPVAGIVQRNGNVIAEVMEKTDAKTLKQLVIKNVSLSDSILLTDEYKSYSRFDAIIEHIKIDHQRMYSYKGLNTNSIESFWAIVKRGIIGQYHSVRDDYLQNYIDEFCFKYNNRKFDYMFETLVFNSMLPPETNFKELNPKSVKTKQGKQRALVA
jgi:transposase-like protein/IS1 family transposase